MCIIIVRFIFYYYLLFCFIYIHIQIDKTASTNMPLAYIMCNIIAWSSVIIDPIIYIIVHQKYRNAIEELITRILHFRQPRRIGILAQLEIMVSNQVQSVSRSVSRRSSVSDTEVTDASGIDVVTSIAMSPR